MALDFGLSRKRHDPKNYQHVGFFNPNEAAYWFLWPLWEKLKTRTGQLVDLYDDSYFSGNELDALKQTLQEARVLVESQPQNWEVVVGWEGHSGGSEVKRFLSKSEMNGLLDALESAAKRATEEELYVVFQGD